MKYYIVLNIAQSHYEIKFYPDWETYHKAFNRYLSPNGKTEMAACGTVGEELVLWHTGVSGMVHVEGEKADCDYKEFTYAKEMEKCLK